MARIDPSDFSQARMAPEDVVRGLEAIDPSACIVHLGGPHWLVGKLRPNAEARTQAVAMLDHWTRAVRQGAKLSPNGRLRVRFAELALLGLRPVQQYAFLGAPTGRIVEDFRQSRFRWLTASDASLEREIESVTTERRAAAIADVASVDRAKDAWHYAFTRSHMPSASLTPAERPKAGRTRWTPTSLAS